MSANVENENVRDPKMLEEDLKHIRDWIAKQPHLKSRQDEQWLKLFLMGCKYRLQETKRKYDMYYSMRKLLPEIFVNRDPLSSQCQDLLKKGVFITLPYDPKIPQPRVLIIRPGFADPNVDTVSIIAKTYLMFCDARLRTYNELVNGSYAIMDLQNLPFKYLALIDPIFAKKYVTCLQDAYPVRIKGIFCINAPTIFIKLFDLVKPIVSKKLQDRVHIYPDNNLSEISKVIPLSILPNEYGGTAGDLKELIVKSKLETEKSRDWFLEDAVYGTDESKRLEKLKLSSDVFGAEGSFRKLNLD